MATLQPLTLPEVVDTKTLNEQQRQALLAQAHLKTESAKRRIASALDELEDQTISLNENIAAESNLQVIRTQQALLFQNTDFLLGIEEWVHICLQTPQEETLVMLSENRGIVKNAKKISKNVERAVAAFKQRQNEADLKQAQAMNTRQRGNPPPPPQPIATVQQQTPISKKPDEGLRPSTLLPEHSIYEFRQWSAQFQAYFASGNLELAPRIQQHGYLFNCLAPDLHLQITQAPEYDTATTPVVNPQAAAGANQQPLPISLIDILRRIFNTSNPPHRRRHDWLSYTQSPGQKPTAYMDQERKLYDAADLNNATMEQIQVTKIITGFTDLRLRAKLLEMKDPSWQELREKVTDEEIIRNNADAKANIAKRSDNNNNATSTNGSTNGNANKITYNSFGNGTNNNRRGRTRGSNRFGGNSRPNNYNSDKCSRCGRYSHQPNDCPFKGATCHECSSTGHIRGMCPKLNKQHVVKKSEEDEAPHDQCTQGPCSSTCDQNGPSGTIRVAALVTSTHHTSRNSSRNSDEPHSNVEQVYRVVPYGTEIFTGMVDQGTQTNPVAVITPPSIRDRHHLQAVHRATSMPHTHPPTTSKTLKVKQHIIETVRKVTGQRSTETPSVDNMPRRAEIPTSPAEGKAFQDASTSTAMSDTSGYTPMDHFNQYFQALSNTDQYLNMTHSDVIRTLTKSVHGKIHDTGESDKANNPKGNTELRSCNFTYSPGRSFTDNRTLPDSGATISMIPHWVLSQHNIEFQKFNKGDAVPRIKTANGTFMKCLGTKTLHVSNCSMHRDIQFVVYHGSPNDTTIIGLTDAKELRLIWTNINGTDNIDMPITNKGGCNNKCAISNNDCKIKCPRCGRYSHHPNDCPFKGASCHECSSTGHIRGMCPIFTKSSDVPRGKLKCARRKSPASSKDKRESTRSQKVTHNPGIIKEVCNTKPQVKEHSKKVHCKEVKHTRGESKLCDTRKTMSFSKAQKEHRLRTSASPTGHEDIHSSAMDKLSKHMMKVHIETKNKGNHCGKSNETNAHLQSHINTVHIKQMAENEKTFHRKTNSKQHLSRVHGSHQPRNQDDIPNVSSSKKKRALPAQFSWAYYDALVSGQVSHEDYIQEPANGIPERHENQPTDVRGFITPSTWADQANQATGDPQPLGSQSAGPVNLQRSSSSDHSSPRSQSLNISTNSFHTSHHTPQLLHLRQHGKLVLNPHRQVGRHRRQGGSPEQLQDRGRRHPLPRHHLQQQPWSSPNVHVDAHCIRCGSCYMLPSAAVLPQVEEAQHWRTQAPAGAHKPQEGRRGRRRREGGRRPEGGQPNHAIQHAHPVGTRHAIWQQQPRSIHGLHAHGPGQQEHQQCPGTATTLQHVPVHAGVVRYEKKRCRTKNNGKCKRKDKTKHIVKAHDTHNE